MAHDRSEVHLAADGFAPPARELEGSAFRVAILGDFAGRSGAAASARPDQRRAWRVDRDDIDAVLSRIAPELRVTLDPSEAPIAVTFASLEDFHPDRLAQRLPLFQRLRALKSELGGASPAAPRNAPASGDGPEPGAAALGLAGGSLLDLIVDSAPSDSPPPIVRRDDLTDFVARAVRSHVVSESTPSQRDLAAKIDGVITATMRLLLHHPQFQSLEALWRGVDFLVRRLDTSESMQVYLVDVSRDELSADLSAGDVTRSAMHRLLVGAQGEPVWSLLVGAYTFDPSDAGLLATLAAVGRAAGAPWIAAAHPRFMGTESFAGTDPDDWSPSSAAAWEDLRASADASFLALASPRFLARVPYGRRGEECETLPFEELGDGAPEHASFLWANPAFICALAIADSVAEGDGAATHASIDGLPLYVAPVNGEPTATPCAETLLTQSAVEVMLDAGLTALAAPRDGDTILVPRIQSVATPPRRLPIRTPVG